MVSLARSYWSGQRATAAPVVETGAATGPRGVCLGAVSLGCGWAQVFAFEQASRPKPRSRRPVCGCMPGWKRSWPDSDRRNRSPAGCGASSRRPGDAGEYGDDLPQSLWAQVRGALKHELTRYLRTGRGLRRPSSE